MEGILQQSDEGRKRKQGVDDRINTFIADKLEKSIKVTRASNPPDIVLNTEDQVMQAATPLSTPVFPSNVGSTGLPSSSSDSMLVSNTVAGGNTTKYGQVGEYDQVMADISFWGFRYVFP